MTREIVLKKTECFEKNRFLPLVEMTKELLIRWRVGFLGGLGPKTTLPVKKKNRKCGGWGIYFIYTFLILFFFIILGGVFCAKTHKNPHPPSN
jgi:hypothetical protein